MAWGGRRVVGLRGSRCGPGGRRGLWGSGWDRGVREALGSRWGQAGPGSEGPGPPRPVPYGPCLFCGPGEGVRAPQGPPRPGGRQGWGRILPAGSPGPAPCPGLPEPRRMLAPLYVAFLSPEGLGSVYLGRGLCRTWYLKRLFFFLSSAKRVRMSVRNGKSALPLLPPADRSRLELFLRFADEERLCRGGSCRWLAGGS